MFIVTEYAALTVVYDHSQFDMFSQVYHTFILYKS